VTSKDAGSWPLRVSLNVEEIERLTESSKFESADQSNNAYVATPGEHQRVGIDYSGAETANSGLRIACL
jgi:hypothetical protein